MTGKHKSGRVIGYNTELAAMKLLRERGMFTIRSSGSHGPADVYGIPLRGQGYTLAVQCKHYDGDRCPSLGMYADDIQRLRDEVMPYAMSAMLWIRIKGGKWFEFLVMEDHVYRVMWIDNEYKLEETVL
jgi:Holliday junction resolvase